MKTYKTDKKKNKKIKKIKHKIIKNQIISRREDGARVTVKGKGARPLRLAGRPADRPAAIKMRLEDGVICDFFTSRSHPVSCFAKTNMCFPNSRYKSAMSRSYHAR